LNTARGKVELFDIEVFSVPYWNLFPSLPRYQANAIINELQKWCVLPDAEQQHLPIVYNASVHGFQSSDFHQHCDGKPYTLTVVVDTSGKIFGGYTDMQWSSAPGGVWVSSKDSWIFQFDGMHGERMTKVTEAGTAKEIFNHPSYLCTFGASHALSSSTSQIATKALTHILEMELLMLFQNLRCHRQQGGISRCKISILSLCLIQHPRLRRVHSFCSWQRHAQNGGRAVARQDGLACQWWSECVAFVGFSFLGSQLVVVRPQCV